MKRIFIITLVSIITLTANAQKESGQLIDRQNFMEIVRIVAVMAFAYLVAVVIMYVLRQILDFRLKNKMIEKGASENVVSQFLQPDKKDSKSIAIKWFMILAGIGLGFLLIAFFPPFGIHSVTIMIFSVSLSFLGYFYYVKNREKE